jgi:pyruvate carboxylase
MERIKNIKEISCVIEADREMTGITVKEAENSKYDLIVYALQLIDELQKSGFDNDEIRQMSNLIKCFTELDAE